MFRLVKTIGHLRSATVGIPSREAAERMAEEWMEEQRRARDDEIEAGNLVAAEIPFSCAIEADEAGPSS